MATTSGKLRLTLFLTAGIALSLIILGGGAYILLRGNPEPADLLPAENTVAYVHGLTEEDRLRLLHRFPLFSEISPLSDRPDVDIAMLRLPSGDFGWVSFISGATRLAMSSVMERDTKNFAVRTSSEEVASLLSAPARQSLSWQPGFRVLTHAATGKWLYLDTRLLLAASATEPDRALVASLSDPFVLIGFSGSGASLTALAPSLGSPAPAPLSFTPEPTFALSLEHPADMLEHMALSDTSKVLGEGVMTAQWKDLMGDDVSLREDVLPHLRGNISFFKQETGTGSIRFLLSAETEGDLRKTLDRLHESAAKRLSTGIVTRRTLEQGFTSVTITDNPSLLSTSQDTENGWDVRRTQRNDTRDGLLTARRGNQLILTNDADWLGQVTSGSAAAAALPGNGNLIAGGWMDRALLRTALRDVLALHTADALLSTFAPASDALRWSVRENSGLLSISLENQ
ncbi:MAG: hypothetical protein WCS85_04575 [Candidatus Peribacteraceae bacterium]|jgi:hypothetical protein